MNFFKLCSFTENLNELMETEPISWFKQAPEIYMACKNICDKVLKLLKEYNKLLNDNNIWKNWNGLDDANREKQLTPICQKFYDKNKEHIQKYEWDLFFELLEDNNYHISNKILQKLINKNGTKNGTNAGTNDE